MQKLLPEFDAPVVEKVRSRVGRTTLRKKILVVDDDAEIVQLVSFNLKAAGFSVGTASNGIEALKKARSIAPDLILLDLMLPELDGFAVCEILRGNPATAAIPIVMLTARSSQLSRCAGLEAGATEYLTKPFSPRELVACISGLLRGATIWTNGPNPGHARRSNLPVA